MKDASILEHICQMRITFFNLCVNNYTENLHEGDTATITVH